MKPRAAVPFILAAALTAADLLVSGPIIYDNSTASMPRGLYTAINRRPEPGDIVVFSSALVDPFRLKLPQTLLKRYAYGPGARITINSEGLFRDGKLIAKRAARFGLSYSGTLDPNQAVVLGENPRSFDSRYFGPVPVSQLHAVRPLLLW